MRLTVPEVLPIATAYYKMEGNSVGGNLHIVLDDHNVRDSDVLFCLKGAEKKKDLAGTLLAKLLLQMTKTQRLKIARTHKGYE